MDVLYFLLALITDAHLTELLNAYPTLSCPTPAHLQAFSTADLLSAIHLIFVFSLNGALSLASLTKSVNSICDLEGLT